MKKLLSVCLFGLSVLSGCSLPSPNNPDPNIEYVLQWASDNVDYNGYSFKTQTSRGVLLDDEATVTLDGATYTGKLYSYLVNCVFYSLEDGDVVYGLVEIHLLVEDNGTQHVVYSKLSTKGIKQ